MRQDEKLDRPYTQTSECFSKIKWDIKSKRNIKERINSKENILNQCVNTIQSIGGNKMFEAWQLANQKQEEEQKNNPLNKIKSEISLRKQPIPSTPLLFNKRKQKHHPHQSSYYNTCHTLCSSQSNRLSSRLHYSNTKRHYPDNIFLTEADSPRPNFMSKANPKIAQKPSTALNNQPSRQQQQHRNKWTAKKSRPLPKLSLIDARLKFPKRRFQSIFEDFNTCTIQTNPLTERLTNPKDESSHLDKAQKQSFEMINTEIGRSRNIASVYSKQTKMFSMIDKANADLMNFGDNYLKINDEQFYHRQKEIMNSYQYLRQNANIEADLPEEKPDRLKKFKRNQFLIAKAFRTMNYEHLKFQAIFDEYKGKQKEN